MGGLENKKYISILIGKEGETDDKTFNAAAMKIHEDFDKNTYENDIAVLKLDRLAPRSSFRLSPGVIICKTSKSGKSIKNWR